MGSRRENDSHQAREDKVGELGRSYAAAVLSGDEVGAELVIRDAIDVGLTVAEVDDEIIAPALWLVGELWECGEISVADEHLATEISVRVLALEREARRVARDRPDVICLSGTMPGSGDQMLMTIHEVQRLWAGAGFIVGGRGLTSRMQSLPGIEVCHRIADVVEVVDAVVKRASMN
jgi:methanogenic corrinoid protein MtbC1